MDNQLSRLGDAGRSPKNLLHHFIPGYDSMSPSNLIRCMLEGPQTYVDY